MEDSVINILENDSIPKALVKLSLPAIVGMLICATYNMIDTYFVSQLGITSATAAISIVFPLFILIGAVGLIFGVGGGTYVSRMLGEKNRKQADIVASTSLFTIIVVSIITTILGTIFIKQILAVLGANELIMPYAISYSRIIFLGIIFTMTNMTMENLIRAEGNAIISMLIIVSGAIINIILDPIFMFVFGLGLEGAAYATVLSQAISFTLFVFHFIKAKSYVKLSIKSVKISKTVYVQIMKVGIPAFIKQALVSISVGLINKFAIVYGVAAIAAMGITMRVTSMGMMLVIGFAQGFQPLAAYNYGAKKIKRLLEAIRTSIIWLTSFAVIFSVIVIIVAKPIVSKFSQDTEVIEIGVLMFRAFCTTFVFSGFIMIYSVLFEAIGKDKNALVLAISRQGLFFIPSLYILPIFYELNGIIWAQPIADFFSLILAILFSISINKELKCIPIDANMLCNPE
ncbi:MAG: MATE family efflux transporter [Firmicutes bacterium HGW-Firmicutes-7]|nr:MAG: MATE family efflux transporter [Firmicutes bacterium HGW-Firmicutes-7]